ncbi:hypothetical protein HDE_11896 [Halotydeus destructor]|nr:hypothetical protein HDE_11896 [Halotydeus destructor]
MARALLGPDCPTSVSSVPTSPEQSPASKCPRIIASILFIVVNLLSEVHGASGRGGAITRGSGGASGARRRHQESDESGTYNVVLVVILPVAQMILVLVVISLVRVCYVRYCYREPDPKLLHVVCTVQKHQQWQREEKENGFIDVDKF